MSFSRFRNFISQNYPPKPKLTEANLSPDSYVGRVFIVTGGNSGIGYQLCRILFSTGATIYMASRSKERAEAAINSITNSGGTGQLKFLHLDLNDLKIVQEAAREYTRQESKLDVLWNNAGSGGNMVKYTDRTAQGFEPLMGANAIGTLLFTELLRPLLQAAAAASPTPGATRVLWLTSILADTHAPQHGIDWSKLDTGHENRVANYAVTKAASWILGREFGRRHEKDGILSLALNPGNVRTNAFAGSNKTIMYFVDKILLHDTVYGAYTELFAGLSPDVQPGDWKNLIVPWGIVRAVDDVWRTDIAMAMKTKEEGGLGYGDRLWEWCEEKWQPHLDESSSTALTGSIDGSTGG
ncbi:hypothetical protein F4778DRAFT_88545 [Xylariomycetidae sp. FL2044]|nr:hypothetical protein F4778DRAFT_88545 [Xylariomycetidae sp. FL2044]